MAKVAEILCMQQPQGMFAADRSAAKIKINLQKRRCVPGSFSF